MGESNRWNNYAISTADLAQSLTKSSASLVAAGGDLAEAAALTATANKIIQDADSVGTALKTTSLRLRGTDVKVLEEEGLDSEGAVTSKSKLQGKVKALSGVDILTETGEYKSTYEILSEIANVWSDINDMDQAALLELISGKRNSSVVAAILQNPKELKEAYEDAQNAEGSALKENEKYLDSIQGKIDQFNNATQAMWTNLLENDAIKGIIDLGTALMKVLDAVNPLNVAFVGMFIFLEKKFNLLSGLFKPAEGSLAHFKLELLKAQKDLDKATKKFEASGSAKDLEKKKAQEQRVKDITSKLEEKSTREDVDKLTQQREVLLQKQAAAQQKVNAPDATEEAKQDLVQINAELEKTNKELAEAEARLAKIDSTFEPSSITKEFDPAKQKKSITGKKGARTKRIKKLQAEGKTPDEIQADPQIKQYTKEIEEAEQALNEYNEAIRRTNATTQQASATTQANTVATEANAASSTASAAAETADAVATNMGAAADANATVAQNAHTASTFAELIALAAATKMKWADFVIESKRILADKLRNSWLIKNAIAQGVLTTAEAASLPVTALLKAGVEGLAAAFVKLWGTLWPILLIVLAVVAAIAVLAVAIWGIVKGIDALHKSSKELEEELSSLKEEINDIKSEIESLNGELETTQERMEELLAKDSLTFTEKEELDNLQKQNDLLERQIYLLEQKEQRLQREAQKTFDDWMENETGNNGIDAGIRQQLSQYEKAATKYEEAQQELLEAEKELDAAEESGDEKAIRKAEKKVEKLEKKAEKKEEKVRKNQGDVDEKLAPFLEAAEGIDYESADEETRKYLDYIYNSQDKAAIVNGDSGAKTMAIKRIFNKDDMDAASKEIDELVKKLAKNPDDKNIIAQISEQCKLAESDLQAVGLSIQDATDYFTKLGTGASFDTIDGKLLEINTATSQLQKLLSDTNSEDFAGLFDKDGNVVETAIADYFKGTSEATRTEIANLVKSIKEDKLSVEDALRSFELFSVQSIIDIQVKEVQTNFKDVFTDLEDADGLIDTFNELGEAIGSTADAMKAFNQAQADVADKGFVSIQTALQLMEYTDDYGSVLQVVDGKLQLAADAEQNLIQARIDAIKVSAQTAVADAQTAYNKAELAVQSYRSAMVEEISASTVATAWQKIVGVAAGVKNALDNIFSGENVVDLYNSGYNAYLESATGYETSYDDAGLQALEDALADAGKKLSEAKGNVEIANAMTAEGLENLYESSESGSPEEVANDAFQKEMDYWENRIGANQARYEQLQNEIDLLEVKGQKADASFYEEQIELENQRLFLLGEQKKAAQTYLATLTEGSEEWWEVANTLNDIENELDDVTSSILDLQDAIGEIETYKFEEFGTRLDNLINKLETIGNLIAPNGEEDWFSSDGSWTESGVAVLGKTLQQLEMYKQGYQETMDELAKYEPDYENNKAYYEALGIHSEQEWYDKTSELIDQQYEFAESISDTEQSVIDMYESSIDAIEEYTGTLIDSYNDYIDSVKEALDAERDLYNFKKNVQKQTKDIAALERRIASLSGSTNASDIAERRRLEADLYGAREELDDTYYEHAKDAQSEALDREAEAYEESMNSMIEGLRTSLEAASMNMDEFLMGVTSMVMYNADTVLSKYEETNLPLTTELTNPWIKAKEAVGTYSGDALALMNKWTEKGGFFAQFNASGTTNLQSPWSAGTNAANSFKNSVSTVMSGVVSNISSNVRTASGELSKLYQQIQDTERRAANANVVTASTASTPSGGSSYTAPKKYYVNAFLDMGGRSLSVTKSGSTAAEAMSAAKIAILGEYEKVKGNSASAESSWLKSWKNKVKYTTQYYAKGTTGTKDNTWAITDEPQFGDELVLVPGKDGNLSFMRKGTGVVPADMTQKLFELAQIPTSALMNKNLMAIVPNITKNDFKNEFNFESLVHVDKVDSDTLPKLEKMVDKKIDDFSKALNYSIKKFAR